MANSKQPYEHLTKNPLAEMSRKTKLYLCFGLVIVCFFFYATFSGNSDQFVAMKQSMDEYELLLRETREQILDRLKMCQRDCQHWDPDLPIIYIVTPTYTRAVQKAELTRFSQTLMLVSNIHWIVIEDSPKKTLLVENFLARSSLNYTHLCEPTPAMYKRKGAARGVVQRNAAIKWLRRNRSLKDKGVVYFADDDNTYAIQVFREMRYTKEVSVWPVGLAGGLLVEKPVVNMTTGKVIGFNSAWRPDRMFPIDMAGFAINLSHLLKKTNAAFTYNVTGGFQETYILQQLTTKDRLEPKAENCTQVLVWHTRTENPRLSEESKLKLKGAHSDSGIEVNGRCCDEEPDPPPFKGGKRSEKSKKPEGGPSKKKDAPRKKKESKLNAIEEEMREKEQQIEDEHSKNWYLGEDYLEELQHRLDTCFRVSPIDPSILSVYKCYLENKDDPMKCRNFSTVLKKDTQEKMKRFVEKSQKMLGDKSKK